MNRKLLALGLIALLVAACGREDVTDDATDSAAILEHVPADTPYLIANLQTLPPETEESLWLMMENYSDAVDKSLESLGEAAGENDPDGWLAALAEEFKGRFNREGLQDIGLDINTHYAVYGLGPIPVMRTSLADSAAFDQALERIEGRADGSLPRGNHAEIEYFRFPMEGALAVMATVDGQLVVSLLPEELESDLIGSILGTERPVEAFAATRLSEFNREHGYLPYGSGFFDIQDMVSRFLADPGAEMDTLRSIVGLDLDEISAACSAEYEALAGMIPRLVTGYSQMDGSSMTSHMRLMLEEKYAGELARVAKAPVDLTEPDGGLVNLALALDLVALRDFARARLDELSENPPQCETFAHINENLEEWRNAVNRPIPPIVTNVHGLRLQLNEFTLANGNPENIKGLLAVHMRNPQLLFGMAEMFSPDLAALEIRPGGDPVALPPGVIPAEEAEGLEIFIAMTDESIGLAFSEDESGKLKSYLSQGKGDGGTLFAMGYDTKAYADLMRQYMTPALDEMDGDDATTAEQRRQMEEQLESSLGMAEAIRRTWMEVRLNEQGVDIEQKIYLD